MTPCLSLNKKNNFVSLLIVGFLFLILLTGITAWAADPTTPTPTEHFDQGLVPCGKGSAGPEDCKLSSLVTLINNVLRFLLWVGTIVATAMIIYAGGRMVYFSGTNPAQAKAAKKILWNVVIGYLIMIVAWLVIKQLLGFFAGNAGALFEALKVVFGTS